MMATALGKYTFEVQKDATKVEIAQAVELAFPGRKVKKFKQFICRHMKKNGFKIWQNRFFKESNCYC